MNFLEPIRKKRPAEDDSFIGMRVGVLLLIGLLMFGVLAFRLWYLQILSGDTYAGSATANHTRTVVVEAPRGVIYDRSGSTEGILVENRAGLGIGFLPMEMPDPDKNPTDYYTEMTKLADLLNMPVADLLAVYDRAKSDKYMTRVAVDDVKEETVAYLKEHSEEFPGIQVEKTYLRNYPQRALAAHVLGYVGEISDTDLDQEEFADLTEGVHIGKDGVERKYDSYLRGTDGWKTVEVDAAGRPVDFIEDRPAESGYSLTLTVDSKLQKAAEEALQKGIDLAHRNDFPEAAGGAVVAMDPRNGEILAMASYPNYDPSDFVGGIDPEKYAEYNADEQHQPLFDRALNGLYPAGSTFKPFVASVALDSAIISADDLINCTGEFKVGEPGKQQRWKDWVYPDGHGDVNLVDAIQQSCDVYFYTLGKRFYEQPRAVLQEGLRQFGFGRETGVDLPGETNESRVPDKDYARANGQVWRTGDEVNLAIGQGDLLVTPLQLAVALSAIVNSGPTKQGTVWVPRLALEIKDSSGALVHSFKPEPNGTLDMSDSDVLGVVRQGMRRVIDDTTGTAHDVFAGFPVSVGGKTGTAQKKPDKDYALFMGYAPADGNTEPDIVVVAIIEQGGHGSSIAGPVVRYVMESYFDKPHAPMEAHQTE